MTGTGPAQGGLIAEGLSYAVGEKEILKGVGFELAPGELLGIVGPNGAGKSTLLRIVVRMLTPGAGSISLLGRAVESYPRKALAREMAYVPQETDFTFPFSVLDVVLMGRSPYIGRARLEGARDFGIAAECLSVVDMEDFAERLVTSLSGGEKQLVSIARALAQEPRFLLLDEPTSNLDIHHQLSIMGLLKTLSGEGRGVAVVLHDLRLAARFCTKILVLNGGEPEAYGPPAEVLTTDIIEKVFRVSVYTTVNPLNASRIIDPVDPI